MATIDTNMSLVMIDPNEPLELYDGTIIKGRLEWFLYALCCLDYGNLPTPLSRIEEWANALITNELPNMEPQSRAEEFFKAILTGDTSNLPTPQSRSEVLLDKLARGENDFTNVEKIQSRYEFLLAYLIKNGGGIGNIDYILYKFQKEDETLYNTKERPVKSAILKGNTLVNLFDIDSISTINGGPGNQNNDGWIIFTNDGNINYQTIYYNSLSQNIKIGEKYIAFLYIDKNTIGDVSVEAPHSGYYLSPMKFDTISTIGIYVSKPFIANYSDGNTKEKTINFRCITRSTTVGELKFRMIILPYQDNMENWDIPYFEGIQSVKLPVLTTYTNLFTGFITRGYIGENGQHLGATSDANLLSDYIEIFGKHLAFRRFKKDGTPVNSFGEFAFYDADKNFIDRRIKKQNVDESVTVPENTKYIRIWSRPTNDEIDEIAMLIHSKEKPSTITEYQPCKTNILSTSEDVELRGVGGVRDELNLLTGEVVERVGEYQITGEENWQFLPGGRRLQIQKPTFLPNIKCGTFACDVLKAKQGNDGSLHATNGTYYIGYTSDGWIRIILGEDLSSLEQGIEWLKANKPTIQYQLKTESIKTVDLTITDQGGATIPKLNTFDKITHVNVSATDILPGEVEMEVATTIGEDLSGTLYSTMEDIETKQEALKESNNDQTESINSTMMATTEIYESLL